MDRSQLVCQFPSQRESGPERRRRWSEEEKARIVAESLVSGAVTRHVALRHGIHPDQLYTWRHDFRRERRPATDFVPVRLHDAAPPGGGSAIEIAVSGMVVRVVAGIDLAFLTDVLRAAKATE
jgi:transposase